MKRAARSIQPSLRRCTFQNHVIGNAQRRFVSHRNIRHGNLLSSVAVSGGQNGITISNHNDGKRNASSTREEKQMHRGGKGKRQRQRDGNSRKTPQTVDTSVFATIHEAQDSMQDLLDRLVAIDNEVSSRIPPITVQNLALNDIHPDDFNINRDVDYNSWKERISIFREAGEHFDALVRTVEEGLLSPSRKHGKDLLQLAECLLYICSQQQPYHPTSLDDTDAQHKTSQDTLSLETDEIIGAIEGVLKTLEIDWNLDVSHRHYEQAIATACNCREWAVASDLFEKQIDPNAGGQPVQLSIENPLGLYAMAQRYQQEYQIPITKDGDGMNEDENESMVAEQIMDAVQRLVMVSPQDRSTYVLAAGNALGHSGCWKELNDYRKSSFLSPQYGTSLVAAVIRACILCEDYDAALDILVDENILSPSLLPLTKRKGLDQSDASDPFAANDNTNNLEEEWQWGGARDRMDPLIRDLAMQVIGGASSMLSRDTTTREQELDRKIHDYCDSRLALELFRQSLEENVTISQDALLGVVEACERDKDGKEALSVLRTILEEVENDKDSKLASWIVSSEQLSIVERDQLEDSRIDTGNMILPHLGPLVASVMRNCNSTSNFGLSLFALKMYQNTLLQDVDRHDNNNCTLPPEEGISQMLSQMNMARSSQEYEELLVACMVALSGLRCHKNAMRLYEMSVRDTGIDIESSAAPFVYQYASLNQKRHGTPVIGNPWLSAHDHIDRLTKAGWLVRNILRETITGTSENNGKGAALSDRQREGIEEILAHAMNSCTNAHQPQLSLYLVRWIEESVFSQRLDTQSFWVQNNRDTTNAIDVDNLRYGDSVTAETILALRWTKDLTGSIDMFEAVLEKHGEDDLIQWRKTIVAGLTAMVANGRGSDAVKIFEVLDGNARSTASYATIGRHLSKVNDWKELIDLYRKASTEGYSSEELSLLALLAVTSTKVDNRLRVLRAIVDDCANSVGLDSKQWTMTKYWQLKRTLGFYHARLLMWWNDEERAPLDEMNLAIKEFHKEKANGMRPKNDVVRAIFAGAQQYDGLGLELQKGYDQVPRSEDQWATLLGTVLQTVQESPVRYDPNFVDSVVQAYKSLGKPEECLDYVSNVLEVDRTRIRRSTLEDVLEAAKAENAYGLSQDIEMLLSTGRTMPSNHGEESISEN